MNAQQTATFIVVRWICGSGPNEIVAALAARGVQFTRDDAMKVVRRYIELTSENKALVKSAGNGER